MASIGKGIDCIHFVREILIAGGASERFDVPYYVTHWGLGRANNIMERLLTTAYHARRLEPDEPVQDGDVYIFSVGRQSNHCGISLGGQCWHVAYKNVVQPTPPEQIMDRLQSIVRITSQGLRLRPETLNHGDFQQ